MSEGKFLTLWMKYLPAIRILLKKSLNEDQQISLGKMELATLDNRKNANFSFNLAITKGKVENTIGVAAIGKDLFSVLSNDSIIKSFMDDKNISIQMTRASLLTLKSTPV
ncbi:MAG TPA: hypothetical protein VNS58_30305 [Puia sp.]|nr:hypothetical protein [Puia sp.]